MFQDMNDWLQPLLLVALFPLLGYLALKHWERDAARAAAQKALRREIGSAGQVTDLAPLLERLQSVKSDFAAASHKKAIQVDDQRTLVALARKRLCHLGFFHHTPASEDSEHKAY